MNDHYYPPRALPHIVLILADSLRARNVTCYGYQNSTTPNLDRLAREGVKFQNCFVQAPFTVASTACLLTGTYASVHRMEKYGQRLPDSLATIPELLRQGGYRTGGFVANPHVSHESGLTRGFDHFSDGRSAWKRLPGVNRFVNWTENGRVLNQEVADFLRDATDKPVFILLFYDDSHVPFSELPRVLLPLVGKKIHTPDFDRYQYSDEEMARILRLYDRAVQSVDACIGEAVELIAQKLVSANTTFFITADHGEGLDRRPNRGGHGRLYDNGIHVPLIAFGNGIKEPNRSFSGLVNNIDLSATILELAGLEIPASYDGESIVPALRAEEFKGQSFVVSEYHDSSCIRTERWKLIQHGIGISTPLSDAESRLELFDLANDREEATNVAAVHPHVAAELQSRLNGILQQAKKKGRAPDHFQQSDLVAERLRGLGYLD